MNKMQRDAIEGLIISFVFFVILAFHPVSRLPKPFDVLVFISFLILWAFWWRRVQKDIGLVDERDKIIARNASYAALITLIVIAFTAILIANEVLGPDACVSLELLRELLDWGLLIYVFVSSVAILVQYRFGGKDA
jgi:Ca2+/Na+ antiporter